MNSADKAKIYNRSHTSSAKHIGLAELVLLALPIGEQTRNPGSQTCWILITAPLLSYQIINYNGLISLPP